MGQIDEILIDVWQRVRILACTRLSTQKYPFSSHRTDIALHTRNIYESNIKQIKKLNNIKQIKRNYNL